MLAGCTGDFFNEGLGADFAFDGALATFPGFDGGVAFFSPFLGNDFGVDLPVRAELAVFLVALAGLVFAFFLA